MDKALAEEPTLIKNVEAAKEKLAKAVANTLNALKGLGLDSLLESRKLDGKLAKCVVLTEATPQGLAEYAQQGKEQAALVEQLLADADLMVQMAVADREIAVDRNGVITIPAAACSKPTKSTGKIVFMPSNLGGKQLHYSRNGNPEAFKYTLDAPKAGTYELTAPVVVPTWDQHLLVAANGAEKPVDIALPLTVGMWDKTDPVEIALAKGENVLTFSRGGDNIRGMTIRDFTLTPVAN